MYKQTMNNLHIYVHTMEVK